MSLVLFTMNPIVSEGDCYVTFSWSLPMWHRLTLFYPSNTSKNVGSGNGKAWMEYS